LSGGTFTTIDDPSATLVNTKTFGINDAGQIVGTYARGTNHGFLLSGGVFTDVDDPQATQGTEAQGINAMGQVVGEYDDATGIHGFLMTPEPNPSPPTGTTADMILRHGADGLYEIYDIGNNAILAANFLGQVRSDFQFAGLGAFNGSDTTDMLLRRATTGAFEVYDISNNIINNQITSAFNIGTVGLNFQVAGFGDFNQDGTTDMMLRNANTGQFEVYDIRNNAITSAFNIGTVGLDFQVAGLGPFHTPAPPT